MSQKVKIQDGIISYSAADPVLGLDFNVAGVMSVTNQLNIGAVNTATAGVISMPDGTSTNRGKLDITTGAHSSLNIYENSLGSGLYMNNVQWPSAVTSPYPGMFLGVSAVNQLMYYPFLIGNTNSDILTNAELNALFPSAQVGQNVVGPTMLYYSIGSGEWRRLGGSGVTPPAPISPVNEITYTSTTTATDQVIDSVLMSTYRAATYRITIVSGSFTQYTEVRMLHDGANMYLGEIDTMTSGPLLATFTADISGGNMRLLSSPVNANTLYTAVSILITSNVVTAAPTATVNTISYTSTTPALNQVVDAVSTSLYRTVTYRVAVASGSFTQYTEIRATHDGTDVYLSEINTLTSGPVLATFSADISSGNMRLLSSPVNANTLYTAVSTLVSLNPILSPQPLSIVNAFSYTSTTVATDQLINSITVAAYSAATYRIAVTSGSFTQYTEIHMFHDGINMYLTEINTLTPGPVLATFSADISGGNMRLLSSPVNANTLYTVVSILISNSIITPLPPPVTSLVNKIIYTATTTTVDQVIDSVPMLNYGAATYRIVVASGIYRQYTEVRILHDLTNVYINEFNTITPSSILATFSADISSGNMRLLSSPVNANTVYTVVSIGV